MRTDPLNLRGLFLVNPSEIIGKVIETELKNNLKKILPYKYANVVT